MREKKKRRRRVVTWWEYLSFLGKKAALSTSGLLLLILFLLTFVPAVFGALAISVQLIVSLINKKFSFDLWNRLLGTGIASSLCLILFQFLQSAFQSLTEMEPVTPLTRHNTGDLPEPKTLVRASAEPPARQADVLLRATQTSQETPEDQLLRPVDTLTS